MRPQTYEESLTCAGCHAGTGRTIDNVFSYARKLDAPATNRGWYAWSREHPIGGFPDPERADGKGEYATYLARNDAGDEFRANLEALQRYVTGKDAAANRSGLQGDVSGLLVPPATRALALDKAYRLIVEEQSFTKGRQPVIEPVEASAHRRVEVGQETGIETPVD